MLNVWLNHWFSTAYHIINLMRQGETGFRFIVTNENPSSVTKLAADEFYKEPPYEGKAQYLAYCLDFCKAHDIGVFAPRRALQLIAASSAEFDKIGVKLLLDTGDIMRTLNDKLLTYEFVRPFAPECVPELYEVRSLDEFSHAYTQITARFPRACFKLSCDEGAASFRVIDNRMDNCSLTIAPGLKVSYNGALKLLEHHDFSRPLIVMPYLSGVEVSADCLTTSRGSIIVPRYKIGGRVEQVRYDAAITALCERLLQKSGLQMPCNIQLRYENHVPYLLEINTRMSGGTQLSCLAAGVNIPNLALNKLIGIEKEWRQNYDEHNVSYVEAPLIV